MSAKPRVNLILDCFILAAFLLTIISGLNLEHALGASSELRSVPISHRQHALSAYLFVGLILTHQLFHWKWIMAQLKQFVKGSRRRVEASGR